MDERERQALEREVRLHRIQIAELLRSLLDLEESLGQVRDAPEKLARRVGALRMALQGRRAAVAVGSARLEILARANAVAGA